jgi:hypothetical protein
LPVDKDGENGTERKLLLNGVIPAGYNLPGYIADEPKDEIEPLAFLEAASLNTWFYMHPDKVCGKEIMTSSREFPLTIKGTREDCERVFTQYFGKPGNDADVGKDTMRKRRAESARAMLELLELEMETFG